MPSIVLSILKDPVFSQKTYAGYKMDAPIYFVQENMMTSGTCGVIIISGVWEDMKNLQKLSVFQKQIGFQWREMYSWLWERENTKNEKIFDTYLNSNDYIVDAHCRSDLVLIFLEPSYHSETFKNVYDVVNSTSIDLQKLNAVVNINVLNVISVFGAKKFKKFFAAFAKAFLESATLGLLRLVFGGVDFVSLLGAFLNFRFRPQLVCLIWSILLAQPDRMHPIEIHCSTSLWSTRSFNFWSKWIWCSCKCYHKSKLKFSSWIWY